MKTTPAPRVDIGVLLPELATRARMTIRLHPERLAEGESLPLDESKMGGDFLWPSEEPWVVCPVHNLPWVGILQLHKADIPEVPFRPGTDLLQVLWCPQVGHGTFPDSDPAPVVIWRNTAEITRSMVKIPRPRLESPDETRRRMVQAKARRWLSQFETLTEGRRSNLQSQGRMPDFSSECGLPAWFLDMPVRTDEQFEELRKAARRVADDLEAHRHVPDYADESLVPWPCRLSPSA